MLQNENTGEDNEYLIKMENNLVNNETIDINDQNFQKMMFLYKFMVVTGYTG